MLKLPPMNSLRAFEAAARTGSFVIAGRELNVSSAAISQQVRKLEEHLGKTLFLRRGNRIFLTDAGEVLYPRLASAFSEITETVDILQQAPRPPRLIISVLPALASQWLLPKLAQFRENSSTTMLLRVDDDPVDFAGDGISIRITYGTAMYEGYREVPLFSDDAIAVCSPKFIEQFGNENFQLASIPDQHFIHNNWGAQFGSAPEWKTWFNHEAGRSAPVESSGLNISDLSLAIVAAKRGYGVALAPSQLVAQDLAAGILIRISERQLKMKKSYVAVYPNALANDTVLIDFLDALTVQA